MSEFNRVAKKIILPVLGILLLVFIWFAADTTSPPQPDEVKIIDPYLCDFTGEKVGRFRDSIIQISKKETESLGLCGFLETPMKIPLLIGWLRQGDSQASGGEADFFSAGPFRSYFYTDGPNFVESGIYVVTIAYAHAEIIKIEFRLID